MKRMLERLKVWDLGMVRERVVEVVVVEYLDYVGNDVVEDDVVDVKQGMIEWDVVVDEDYEKDGMCFEDFVVVVVDLQHVANVVAVANDSFVTLYPIE